MSDPRVCPQCGAAVPSSAPAGLCPSCLLQAGFASNPEVANSLPPTHITPPASTGFVPPTPEELAKLFPQLEILELLGKGGMGAVYKARHPGLDRLVAVKILPSEISHDPAFAERFQREARALARLSHPHIVAVYDFGRTAFVVPPFVVPPSGGPLFARPTETNAPPEGGTTNAPPEGGTTNGLYYFVMEYVDGANLRQMIRAGSLQPHEALAIIPQICDALQFAHDEGIVHRDIKPENILIDKKGRVKIADFGLAKLLGESELDHSLTGTHQVMGTLRYMAPEQMLGSRRVDHRADIYSLGVIFYELLTGEIPMGRFAPPSKRVQIDVRLDEVVLRALEQNPDQRYQSASDVKTDKDAISRTSMPGDVVPPKRAAGGVAESTGSPPVAAWASDAVYFRRLSVINIIIALLWGLLVGALQWGYLTGANWYFKQELPYTILSAWWQGFSIPLVFCLASWWYVLAKRPDTPRSLVDFLQVLQTPDSRVRGAWLPALAYGVSWTVAVLVSWGYGDAAQSISMTAGFVLMPFACMVILRLTYAERYAQLAHGKNSSESAPGQLQPRVIEPRLSRLALWGAIWAPLFLITMAAMTMSFERVSGEEYHGPAMWQLALAWTLLPLGLAAPFGTTILGAVALTQIKRSNGKLYGLRMAQFDLLVYPLLALGGIALLLATLIVRGPLRSFGLDEALFVSPTSELLMVLVALPIWFFPARALWRAVVGPKDAFDLGRLPLIGTETVLGKATLCLILAAIAAHAFPWHWIISPPPSQRSLTISNTEVMEAKISLLLLALAFGASLLAASRSLDLPLRKAVRGVAGILTAAAVILQIQFLGTLGEFQQHNTNPADVFTRSYTHTAIYAAITLTPLSAFFIVMRLFERDSSVRSSDPVDVRQR